MKTDYLYALENILPIKKRRRIILALTNLCNSKCKTCFLWKNKNQIEPSTEDLEKFAGTSIFREARFLALTGGEPFLRKDIDKIENMLKQKNTKSHIDILKNALQPKLIYEKVKNMPKDVLINLSFNGKEETHDDTRGVKGNFKKLLETIEKLKELGHNMSFIFTVTKENHDQLLWAWNFAKEQNINIMFSPEMDYERLNTEKGRSLNEDQKKKVLEQLKKIYAERKRPFFDDTYFLFFKRFYENKTITNTCYAGTNSIYIDFTGNIYPCENLVGKIPPIGNVKDTLKLPKDYTKKIKNLKCYEDCYLLCEMVRNLRKQPLKTLAKR